MIADLLPGYYGRNDTDARHSTIRSMMIDGHEVAIMQLDGHVLGKPEQTYSVRGLYCECDFAENSEFDTADKCLYKQTAVHLIHLKLRQEYIKKFNDDMIGGDNLLAHLEEIFLDLIERVKNGEVIESSNGANFWGGYFYLGTLASITDVSFGTVRDVAEELEDKKKISLEGWVVQEYRKTPRPAWTDSFTIALDGWFGHAHLPKHSKMKQEWKFTLTKPDGTSVKVNERLALRHRPDIGPDAEDLVSAQDLLTRILKIALFNETPQTAP